MSSLVVLAIIAFIVLKSVGPQKRAEWKRSVTGAMEPELSKVRRNPKVPERIRRSIPTASPPPKVTPPPPKGAPLSYRAPSSLPPPVGSPLPEEIRLPAPADPPDAVVLEVEPPAEPGDPVVIPIADEAPAAVEPEPLAAATEAELEATESIEDTAASVDLDLDAVIAAVFGREQAPHERAATFAAEYAGRTVSWTVPLVRTMRARRHREPATRADLVLGYTSERRMYSERVVAEAWFAADVELERDTDITFRATLTEANVYANRLVLDGAEIV